jgi:hypoxanthine phosphoribosyltransferase
LLSEGDLKEVLFTKGQIDECVDALAERISRDYAGKSLLVVVILKGAVVFASDLVRKLDLDVELDFIAASSYGSSTVSSGVVRVFKDISSDIEGKNVLIVEDVLDTGRTLNFLVKNLWARGPETLEVAVIFKKRLENEAPVAPKYLGLECPDEFVVGYGLDYAEKYRNLPFLGILKEEVYSGQR